jgi:hypothetical protein
MSMDGWIGWIGWIVMGCSDDSNFLMLLTKLRLTICIYMFWMLLFVYSFPYFHFFSSKCMLTRRYTVIISFHVSDKTLLYD